MRDDMKDLGYSKEEAYFHRKDQELIAKMRAKAEAHRSQQENENKKKEYWMRCPKCGSTMKEELYANVVTVDRCNACGGVYFDGGEVEILLKAKASLLQKIFGR